MLADVPAQYWLLILVAVWIYPAADYAVRYVAGGPSANMAGRSRDRFLFSLVTIAALIALAMFIFTPLAAEFAYSEWFKPVMIAALAAFAGWTVVRDLLSGNAKLIAGLGPYARAVEPKRYWASVMFGAAITAAVSWAAASAWTGRI